MDEKTLQRHFAELRSKTSRKTNNSENEIRRLYKEMLKELQSFVATEYAKHSKDGTLTYAMLQQKGEYARFLQEVTDRLDGISPDVAARVEKTVKDIYELNYKGMINAVSNAKDIPSLEKELQGVNSTTATAVKRSVENPIAKLTLKDTLENNRRGIIYNIRKSISIGMVNGDRYDEMAKRIADSLDGDYKKSIRIIRTEAHKVQEQGLNDSAIECSNAVNRGKSGLIMVKIWRTGKDERVRDTHQQMEGKIVLADEEFELPSGGATLTPGNSGIAAEDINCRCYCSYKLMTVEEYEKATGKKYLRAKNESA